MRIRVLVVENDILSLTSLRKTINRRRDEIEIVGEAMDGKTALELVKRLRPEIVVTDYSMQGMSGCEVAGVIRKEWPDIKVICVTAFQTRKVYEEMSSLGISGFLIKEEPHLKICEAIKAVHEGGEFFEPSRKELGFDKPARPLQPGSDLDQVALTFRQQQLIRLTSEGKDIPQIAEELQISDKTAYKHRAELMNELKLHSVVEFVKYAVERKTPGA